jgi:hypothetical protein
MIREQIPQHNPRRPVWVGLVVAVVICLPFWAAFTWLVAGLA